MLSKEVWGKDDYSIQWYTAGEFEPKKNVLCTECNQNQSRLKSV